MENHGISGSQFGFSAARIEGLGATEYTLVNIDIDLTDSTKGFADQLRLMLVTAIDACKKSPRSDNLLVRVTTFSTVLGVEELHGYKPLSEIDPQAYPAFTSGGLTNLADATYVGVTSLVDYAAKLKASEFFANAIYIGITDGVDNSSRMTPDMTKQVVAAARREEKLESIVLILIGINATECSDKLNAFKDGAGFDQYIDAGEATRGKLAKLAAFVSHSVSSQSQALGTGGPSQGIATTI